MDFNFVHPLSPPSVPSTVPVPSKSDIVNVCNSLKSTLEVRRNKENTETVISLLMHKNALMEENLDKITAEKGAIQEKARSLSM